MPSSAPQIPAERLADGVAALREWGGGWDNDNAEAAVADVLEATDSHLLAAFAKRVEDAAERRSLNSQDCGRVVCITDLEYILESLEATDAP